ncbi:MAG TPA: TraR/DksA C4-type zinc finger protein [Albitalea sp.]|nr:TraR/DksA C4-type zinc finger protein [Albitalea sp.]
MTSARSYEEVRRLLEQRAGQLRQEIAAAQAREGRGGEHEVFDRKEEASASQIDSVDSAGVERDVDELRQVVAAQERIAGGRYGECEDCGETIDMRRLLAQPTARRCAACEQRAEQRARRSGRPESAH